MIHIGHDIQREVEKQGRSTVWLSRELGCHRTNLYKIYDRASIDTNTLLRISKILDHDFFRQYSQTVREERLKRND